MPNSCPRFVWSAALCLLVLLGGTVAQADGLGPQVYGLVADYALGTPLTSRVLAMGGQLTCVKDVQFANAAFAPLQAAPTAGWRWTNTDFDRGPSLTSNLIFYTHPLRPGKNGLQLTAVTMSGEGGGAMFAPPVGPVYTDMMANAWVLDYGHRLNERLTAGLSILGNERVGLRFDALSPMPTPEGTRAASSNPPLFDLTASADYGARLGAAYEWRPGDFLGLTYNFAQESVITSGMLVGNRFKTDLDLSQLALGVSHHLRPELLVALEYQYSKSEMPGASNSGHSWNFGAEYVANPTWAVRAGVADENPSFGVGYKYGDWRADYTYLHDWKEAASGALLGGSDTHSLQVTYGF